MHMTDYMQRHAWQAVPLTSYMRVHSACVYTHCFRVQVGCCPIERAAVPLPSAVLLGPICCMLHALRKVPQRSRSSHPFPSLPSCLPPRPSPSPKVRFPHLNNGEAQAFDSHSARARLHTPTSCCILQSQRKQPNTLLYPLPTPLPPLASPSPAKVCFLRLDNGEVQAFDTPGARARVRAPHQLLLALAFLQLTVMTLSWPSYSRRRVLVQLAMRSARLCIHAWWTILDSHTVAWWRRRTLSEGADPHRTLVISLTAVPVALLQTVRRIHNTVCISCWSLQLFSSCADVKALLSLWDLAAHATLAGWLACQHSRMHHTAG